MAVEFEVARAEADAPGDVACFDVEQRPTIPPVQVVLGAPVVSFYLPAVTAGLPVDVQWSQDSRADGFDVRPHGLDRDGNAWSLPVERVEDPIFDGVAPAGSGTYCIGVTAIGVGSVVPSAESVACVPFAEGVGDADCDGIVSSAADVLATLARTVGLPNDCLDDEEGSADVDGDGTGSLLDALIMTQCDAGLANGACPALPADSDPVEFYIYMLEEGAFPDRSVFEEIDFDGGDDNDRDEAVAALGPVTDVSLAARLLAENELENPGAYGARDSNGIETDDPKKWWEFDIPTASAIDDKNQQVTDRLRSQADTSIQVNKSFAIGGGVGTAARGTKIGLGRLSVIGAGVLIVLGEAAPLVPPVETDFEIFALLRDGTRTLVGRSLDAVTPTLLSLGNGEAVTIVDYAEGRELTIGTDGIVTSRGNTWSPEWFEDWSESDRDEALESLGAPKGRFRPALGGRPGDGCDAHHIVPHGSKYRAAVASRAILNQNGIGVHDPVNGVLLNREGHGRLHTYEYYDTILFRLQAANRAADPLQRRMDVSGVLLAEGFRLMAIYPCVPE